MALTDALRRVRRAVLRAYYAIKYFPFARERRERHERTERGFLVIQIDALAHDDLKLALDAGHAPHLRRLLDRERWELRRFPSGLPSATPAAQAAIFYGTKKNIPAFRFYEKESGRVVIGSKPADVQFVRDRLPADGILRGGSGYVNIYDGGADRAVFTLAAQQPQRFLVKMGGGRLALLALLHPIRLARMVLASFWEFLVEEWRRLASQVSGRSTHYWWYLPLLHIGSNVVLRELQTLAVMLDIYTGAPSIYTTYNVYDEFAHHFGPRSGAANRAIRAMDRRIGELLRMAHRLPGRPYDIYILSDHGQTPSVPYRVRYGETLGDTIEGVSTHGVLVMAGTGDYTPTPDAIMDFLAQELEGVASEGTAPTRRIGSRLGRWLRRQYGIFPLIAENVKVSPDGELVVTYSSSLAHVYWTQPERPITFGEIRGRRDRMELYYFLVAHGGIGVVITRMLDGAHVESLAGRALLTPQGELELLSGKNPLADYATTNIEMREIVQLVHSDNAGDLVIFGAYDAERDVCVCFDDQVGAHGAYGGRQGWPFIMTPRGLVPHDYPIDDPLDLHPLFRRYTKPDAYPELAFSSEPQAPRRSASKR
jgi:hypothetical protein